LLRNLARTCGVAPLFLPDFAAMSEALNYRRFFKVLSTLGFLPPLLSSSISLGFRF
jgi:hypothetical protein